MEKIKLEVCAGTACYLLGAAEILEILDNLPSSLSGRFDIKGVPCQGFCRKGLKPPFIKIKGEVMGEMDSEKLMRILTEALSGETTC